MPLHPQAKQLVATLAASGARPISESTPEQARARAAAFAQLTPEAPALPEVRELTFPGPDTAIRARLYRPSATPVGTVVYFHGGGWVVGTLDMFDYLCRALALDSGCEVLSVDYRLAPEHPFPAAVDDACAALAWASENVADGRPLVVAGDSAGGNLAAVAARRARDVGAPKLVYQLLVYPVTDHELARPSYAEHGESGLPLGRAEMDWFWGHYVPESGDRSHPDASPLRAGDLTGLPPAYIIVAEYDPLRDEVLEYAERLADAAVPVTLRRYDDMLHGFFSLLAFLDTGREAVADAAAAIRGAVVATRGGVATSADPVLPST